jgi:hypothetical protein
MVKFLCRSFTVLLYMRQQHLHNGYCNCCGASNVRTRKLLVAALAHIIVTGITACCCTALVHPLATAITSDHMALVYSKVLQLMAFLALQYTTVGVGALSNWPTLITPERSVKADNVIHIRSMQEAHCQFASSKSFSKALVQLCSCSAKQCIDMYTALQQLTSCMALRRGTLVLAAVRREHSATHSN